MAKLTQDEKLERTRALLSAPPRERILSDVEIEITDKLLGRTKLQPRPDEIGYV